MGDKVVCDVSKCPKKRGKSIKKLGGRTATPNQAPAEKENRGSDKGDSTGSRPANCLVDVETIWRGGVTTGFGFNKERLKLTRNCHGEGGGPDFWLPGKRGKNYWGESEQLSGVINWTVGEVLGYCEKRRRNAGFGVSLHSKKHLLIHHGQGGNGACGKKVVKRLL